MWLLAARAQQGLHVNQLFQGRIVAREHMVEVKVRGRDISRYNLDFYHSVRCNPTLEQLKLVRDLAAKDAEAALSSEHVVRNDVSTTILSLSPSGATNRYLCVVEKRKGKQITLTVVYMEGKVKNIDELRKLIK